VDETQELERIEKVVFTAARRTVDEHNWEATIVVAQREDNGNLRIAGTQLVGERSFDLAVIDEAEGELRQRIEEEQKAGHELNWPQILVKTGEEETDLAITEQIEKALDAFEGKLEEQEGETGAARVIIGGRTLRERR